MKPHLFTDECRRALVRESKALQRAGYSTRHISVLLDVPWITIYKWEKRFKDAAGEKLKQQHHAKLYRQRHK